MQCKDCEYFKIIDQRPNKVNGSCEHPDIAYPLVSQNSECALTRSKLSCRNCSYWVTAEGYEKEDDCGGCTYGGKYYPMMLDEKCDLKEPYKSEVEREMSY